VPHFDAKGQSDHFFTDAGVPTTFLLTSFYWDNFIHFGMGPKKGPDGKLAITFPMDDKKLPGIAAEDIGRCAYGIFKKGDELIGKTVAISGENLTGAQMAASFSKVFGKEVVYNSIRSLLEDRDGAVWIGTEHGLSQYKNGEFVHDAMTAALRDEKVWALHQDVDGGLWIGTRTHGLYRFRNGQLSHYTTANGLASDSIYSILEDKQGHFWFSGPSGVMLLNRAELDAQAGDTQQLLSLRIFRANEGGKPTQFYGGTQPAGALTASGEAWFPTSQGLWSIRPNELEHPFFSGLKIDAVTVDGRPAPLSAKLTPARNGPSALARPNRVSPLAFRLASGISGKVRHSAT